MTNFYEGKKVVVTGGAGFLGTHVVDMLRAAGAAVYVPRSTLFDLRIPSKAQNMLTWMDRAWEGRPDIVFHLAARVSGIASTSSHPADHLYDNAMMALNVIHACAAAGVKVVVAGSVCAYPENVSMPMVEDDLLHGAPEPTNASYGHAKRLALAALQAYRYQHDLDCAYLLSANLYGPGDNFDPATSHVIPALIRKISEGQKDRNLGLNVWGTGYARRDFLHVRDAARAYLAAGELIDFPAPINIGSGQETSISDLVEMVKDVMGYYGNTNFDRSRPDGQIRRQLDISRAKDVLGWQPEISLEDGLRETVNWWRAQA